MTAILHLIDGSVDPTMVQVLNLLHHRLASTGFRQSVCSIDGPSAARAAAHFSGEVIRAERRLGRIANWSPQLGRIGSERGVGIVHAWGIEAAAVCTARLPHLPLVVTLIDPGATGEASRWLRSLPERVAIAAGSQVIRARLVSSGVLPEQVTVIRGGVDFSAISEARKTDVRREVAGDRRPVVLMSGPASRAGGQYYGLWAAAIVQQVHRGLHVLMPYESNENDRLRQFVRQIRMPDLAKTPDRRLTWAQLVSCADVFLIPAEGEECTESIAWAMAAGVPVVGSAVRSIAEIIADKHNGLLCKPAEPRALAGKLLTAIEDQAQGRKLADTARGQAYEVFSVRAFQDNYTRLYENALAGRPARDGIQDTAMVA